MWLRNYKGSARSPKVVGRDMEMKCKIPTARLETATGDLVTTVEVLPFNEPPDVIIWGTRIFKLHKATRDFVRPDVYRECFAWTAVAEVKR